MQYERLMEGEDLSPFEWNRPTGKAVYGIARLKGLF